MNAARKRRHMQGVLGGGAGGAGEEREREREREREGAATPHNKPATWQRGSSSLGS